MARNASWPAVPESICSHSLKNDCRGQNKYTRLLYNCSIKGYKCVHVSVVPRLIVQQFSFSLVAEIGTIVDYPKSTPGICSYCMKMLKRLVYHFSNKYEYFRFITFVRICSWNTFSDHCVYFSMLKTVLVSTGNVYPPIYIVYYIILDEITIADNCNTLLSQL